MPDVSPVGNGPLGQVSRRTHTSASLNGAARTDQSPESTDRVELSDRARFLNRIPQRPTPRIDRVEAIRQALADGTYETPERLNTAIERLIEEVS